MDKKILFISAALAVVLIVLLWLLFRELVLAAIRWGAILIGVGIGAAFVALIGKVTSWAVVPTGLAILIDVVVGIAIYLRLNKKH